MKYLIIVFSILSLLLGCEKDTSVVAFEDETLPDLVITDVTIEQTLEPDSSISCLYTIFIKNVGDTLFDGAFYISISPGDNSSTSSRSSGSTTMAGGTDTLYFGMGYSPSIPISFKNYGVIIKINRLYTERIPQVPEHNYENNLYFIASWPFQ